MNPESYRELILYDLSSISENIYGSFQSMFWKELPAFLLIGVVLTFMTSWDFTSILKRIIIGVMALSIAIPMFKASGEFGFTVGARVLSKDNIIIKDWKKATSVASTSFRAAKADESDSSFLDFLPKGSHSSMIRFAKTVAKKSSNLQLPLDFVGFVFWTISNMALWFVKVSFSLAFWLPQCLLPIIVLMNILPVASKSIEGVLISIVWVGITPIVIATMMELFTGILLSGGEHSPTLIAKGIMAIIFALYLIGSMALSKSLIGGDTISSAVSGVGQSYGTGMVMGASSAVSGFFKSRASRILFSSGGGRSGVLRKMATLPLTAKRNSLSTFKDSIDAQEARPMDILKSTVRNNSADLGMKKAQAISKGLNPHKTKKLTDDYTQAAYLMNKDGLNDRPVTSEIIEKYKKTDRWKSENFKNNYSEIEKQVNLPLSKLPIKPTRLRQSNASRGFSEISSSPKLSDYPKQERSVENKQGSVKISRYKKPKEPPEDWASQTKDSFASLVNTNANSKRSQSRRIRREPPSYRP